MKTYKATIQGTTPLLMNRPNQLEISDKSKDVKRENRTSKEMAEDKLYKDANGKIYIPATHIQGSLIGAGKQKKMGGKGSAKATYSKVVGYAVQINPFEILHKKTKWDVFSILAVNPTTHGRNPLHRPILKEWEADFEVSFDEDQIEPSVLKEIFDIAGKFVGIGDWRPEKKGPYGKFQLVSWKEVK